jgi:phospholipid/cholesterol/gamma-HCH transport system permease protein
MKVTGEIDSLRAVGASPIEVLVLPRIAALAIVLPLLTVSADVLAVAGGMAVARADLAIGRGEFLERIAQAVHPTDYVVGLVKAPLFGALVAAVACYHGLHVGDDAESVGRRTTMAVVHSMFLVILADALLGVLSRGLGI